MITVDISSNIDEIMEQTNRLFERQIPYVTAVAINNTLFDVRKYIVNITYPKAFKVNNQRFAAINWRVDKIKVSGDGGLSSFKRGDVNTMSGMVYQKTLTGGIREWTENQAEGGTKTPRGSMIAIPTDPAARRNKGGSVKKRDKPRNITNKRGHFIIKRGGKPLLIAKRKKGQPMEVIYNFVPSAQIKPTFRFYPDAYKVVDRVIGGHWSSAMTRVINKTGFTTR
jgi:hypothetical protein